MKEEVDGLTHTSSEKEQRRGSALGNRMSTAEMSLLFSASQGTNMREPAELVMTESVMAGRAQ